MQHETTEQVAARDLGMTDEGIERRRRSVGLTEDDIRKLAKLEPVMRGHVDALASAFFDHLLELDESKVLTANRDQLNRVRTQTREQVQALFSGKYDVDYATQRLALALLYTRMGLEQRVFLGAYQRMMTEAALLVLRHFDGTPSEANDALASLQKVSAFDLGILIDAMVLERERTIRKQADEIRELSTPVLQLRDRMLLLPIIGVIDTYRARGITEGLLKAIRAHRAKVVVMDITGVATIDSKVANHLMQTVAAAKLMGAVVVVTGLSSEVAQSLVALGVEVDRFNTVGDLQGGIEEGERLLGYRVVSANDGPFEQRA